MRPSPSPARRRPSTLRRSLAAALLLPAVVGGFALQAWSGRDGERVFHEVMAHVARAGVDSVGDAALYESAARGLLREIGDPYAELFSPEQLAEFSRQTLRNSYAGVGMQIGLVRDTATVMRVFAGSPAERAGVRTGDRIVAAGGADATGIPLAEVTARLLGTPGTSVEVTYLRGRTPIERTLVRQRVRYPSVTFALMLEPGIGYVPLEGFNDTSADEVGEAVALLRSRGAKSFVLDLRGNTGGSVDQALRISSLFLPAGTPLLRAEFRDAPAEEYAATPQGLLADDALVVLTDGSSASASEIVAGALQDHDRAVVLGTATFGKGVVQDIFTLDGGWALKLTTGRWFTPSGRTIQRPWRVTAGGQMVAEPVDSASRPLHRSASGRPVYGGGGITPDLVVHPDTLAGAERALMLALTRHGGAVNQVLQEMAFDRHGEVAPGFRSSAGWRAELRRRLDARGVAVDRERWEAGAPLLDRLLEGRISEMAHGDSASFRRGADRDAQLQAAVRVLRGAPSQAEALRRASSDAAVARS